METFFNKIPEQISLEPSEAVLKSSTQQRATFNEDLKMQAALRPGRKLTVPARPNAVAAGMLVHVQCQLRVGDT